MQNTGTTGIGFMILALCMIGVASVAHADEPWIITKNPYDGVDWETFGHHKANLHTHTTNSDGNHEPQEVIDDYHEAGYEILAITDHNHVTWSWEDYGRDPDELLMVAIVGNELSRHHHTNTFFTEYPQPFRDNSTDIIELSLHEQEELGGISHLNHPGRYWDLEDDKVPQAFIRRYSALFQQYPSLVGFEIHNQNDRYPQDRPLWDALLDEFMPRRAIWGFANDDTHSPGHVGLNANVFVLRELSVEQVHLAMIRGQFYSSTVTTHANEDHDWALTPRIVEIDYDREAGTVRIEAETDNGPLPQEAYRWISAGGEEVEQGDTIDLNNTDGLDKYLRAEIEGEGGTTYTQPFGIRQRRN